ncbi:MAG: Superoxide dismutase [Mn] [Phycisphaerae bacterium]|nr:Superoxide dismutase [Mn] [Phycisphaerae bacterium]
MSHTLPPLPYAYDALEPHIDARTMEIHHTKHHSTYVTSLNKALEGQAALANKPLEQLLREVNSAPDNIRQMIINHGGGHANHTLFWQIMGSGAGGSPRGDLAKAIDTTFGTFDSFKEKFTTAATTRFGSGWAWLTVKGGQLHCFNTLNQDSPIMESHHPILGLDVWEHAYYLKYQNRRPDYITAWWNVINWNKVAELYDAARKA